MSKISISSLMKCPHCLLELRRILKYDKEFDQCSKCEGIWLDKETSDNMFDLTDGDKEIHHSNDYQDREHIIDENYDHDLLRGYHYYKKSFTENAKLDDIFDFE